MLLFLKGVLNILRKQIIKILLHFELKDKDSGFTVQEKSEKKG